ncbi:hypothetical protein LUZ61_009390 [Rhynchospora tenuis]|uniref:Dirigent protein n=1 Tax=Rhynchospora tenuis TaxID=198213 RepID=A0AAD6EYI4_9POAL|nr:hypothetical protein LUZ61_009390 [Rhynchospora tenuis]
MEPGVFNITPTKNEIKIRGYLDWTWAPKDKETQAGLLAPVRGNRFGEVIANCWPLYDSDGPNKKVLAFVRGKHVQASYRDELGWFFTVNLVFKDASGFKGSTLQVMGNDERDSEWAIVGGTGQFANAQGILQKKILNETNSMRFFEVNIRATYTPPKKAT